MLHLQGYYSYQKSVEKSADLTLRNEKEFASVNIRRSGFSIGTIDGKRLLFHKLNEAVITELEIRFEKTYLVNWPELAKELKLRNEYIEHVAWRDNVPVEMVKQTVAGFKGNSPSEHKWFSYSYHDERQHLNNLIDELYRKNINDFNSREGVFKLFADATINGRLLPVARLIEKTFGKGAFKIIGEKSSDK